MTLDRRAMLGGIGASIVAAAGPARHADARGPTPTGTVTTALDEAAQLPPGEALARLAAFPATALPLHQRLDLLTARAGLAIDARLAQLPGTRGPAGGYRPVPDAGPITPDHYALLLARPLGSVAPRAAQARLKRALERLHAKAAPSFAAIGLDQGSIGARYTRLWQDERYLYGSQDAAVGDMARLLAAARDRTAATIGPVPAWCVDVAVRYLSPEEIAAGKNGYRIVPTPTRQGAYIVDLKQLRRRPSWTLPSVVAHELLPGHMIQLGVEGIVPPHPLRIDYAASFVEGWGIYAEQLAAVDGAFADPRAMLGHLHWLIFRVGRALVDLGIHLDRWSPDEARARLIAWQGEAAYFAPFDTELPRIRQEPAARVAEAMAWLAIADAMAGTNGRRRIARHQRLIGGGRRRIEQMQV